MLKAAWPKISYSSEIPTSFTDRLQVVSSLLSRRELPLWTVGTAFIVGYAAAKAVIDYREWYSLGEGGVSRNIFGWIIAGACKVYRMRDTRSTSHYTAEEKKSGGYIGNIIAREGSRPTMAKFVIPLRATDQDPYPDMAIKIEDLYASLAGKFSSIIIMRTSMLERFCTALYLANPTVFSPSKDIGYEITHYHPYDHSIHVVLHPSDAQRVIESGWAEHHPLSGQPNFFVKLPKTYVLVYAPRNDKELEIVQMILEAGIKYHMYFRVSLRFSFYVKTIS